jgi:hypothetical protein
MQAVEVAERSDRIPPPRRPIVREMGNLRH